MTAWRDDMQNARRICAVCDEALKRAWLQGYPCRRWLCEEHAMIDQAKSPRWEGTFFPEPPQ